MCRIRKMVPLLLIGLLLTGCAAPATPPATLDYAGPSIQTVRRGDLLPGTNMRYAGTGPDGAAIDVGGQLAWKRTGDSLDWSGAPVPGINANINQRLVTADAQRMIAAGVVRLAIASPAPATAQFPDKPAWTYTVGVTHRVGRGQMIPGTTISYEGTGSGGARIGGVSGYAFRKLGDSITWRGQLRERVYLELTLRVLPYTDDVLNVAGLAKIAVTNE